MVNVYKPLFLNTFFFLILAGCTSVEKRPVSPGGFELKGKLAVEEAGERHSGNFLWYQQGDAYGIDVWGPFGQGRIHLTGDARTLSLIDGKGAVVQQGPSEQVMMASLGWSMPLEVLSVWVLGAPDPELPVVRQVYGEDGRLASFEQAGWAIEFAQYRQVEQASGSRWLPRKVDVRRAGTRIRLIIAEWQIAEGQI
jgi:outer membrane lipoprotein LolB